MRRGQISYFSKELLPEYILYTNEYYDLCAKDQGLVGLGESLACCPEPNNNNWRAELKKQKGQVSVLQHHGVDPS